MEVVSSSGMVRSAVRTGLCLLLGIFAGRVLGPLFVPDPTGPLATVLTVVVAAVGTVVLYRSDWWRELGSVP